MNSIDELSRVLGSIEHNLESINISLRGLHTQLVDHIKSDEARLSKLEGESFFVKGGFFVMSLLLGAVFYFT